MITIKTPYLEKRLIKLGANSLMTIASCGNSLIHKMAEMLYIAVPELEEKIPQASLTFRGDWNEFSEANWKYANDKTLKEYVENYYVMAFGPYMNKRLLEIEDDDFYITMLLKYPDIFEIIKK